MQIKIAIADDHPMVIKGLQQMLAGYPEITLQDTYSDGETLLAGLDQREPDVLLLDIQLPGQTGDELVPVILKKHPGISILMLTNFDSTLYAGNALRRGALGYLLKTADEDALITAIHTVFKKQQYLEPSMQEKIDRQHTRMKYELRTKTALTIREKQILQLIINGYTGQEIADELHIGFRTVENYRFNILLKLEVKNTAALVKKALTLGLVE